MLVSFDRRVNTVKRLNCLKCCLLSDAFLFLIWSYLMMYLYLHVYMTSIWSFYIYVNFPLCYVQLDSFPWLYKRKRFKDIVCLSSRAKLVHYSARLQKHVWSCDCLITYKSCPKFWTYTYHLVECSWMLHASNCIITRGSCSTLTLDFSHQCISCRKKCHTYIATFQSKDHNKVTINGTRMN